MMTIGERQIRGILQQLFMALEVGKEYLLVEEDFVLSPNYIFVTFPQMELALCYVPGYGISLKEQLEGLFEYLLNRVDYDDKKAVELLYNCYMFCMKEQGGLKEIKYLLEQQAQEITIEQPGLLYQNKIESTIAVPKKIDIEENKKSFEIEEKQESDFLCHKKIDGLEQNEKKEKTVTKKKGKKKVIYSEMEEKVQTTSYISWISNLFFPKQKNLVIAEEKEEYQVESMKERVMEESERTMLLSVMSQTEEVTLICSSSGEVIPITKFPFYIGSTSDYVDYVL